MRFFARILIVWLEVVDFNLNTAFQEDRQLDEADDSRN